MVLGSESDARILSNLAVDALIAAARHDCQQTPGHIKLFELSQVQSALPLSRQNELHCAKRMKAALTVQNIWGNYSRLSTSAKNRGLVLLKRKLLAPFHHNDATEAVLQAVSDYLDRTLTARLSHEDVIKLIHRHLQLEFEYTPTSAPNGILINPDLSVRWLETGDHGRTAFRRKAVTDELMRFRVLRKRVLERLLLPKALFIQREAQRRRTENHLGIPLDV